MNCLTKEGWRWERRYVLRRAADRPLLTECGLMEPVQEMEFTAHFSRADGEFAAEAAAVAVTRVIYAPLSFVTPVLDAGRSASKCLLARSAADTCRIVHRGPHGHHRGGHRRRQGLAGLL